MLFDAMRYLLYLLPLLAAALLAWEWWLTFARGHRSALLIVVSISCVWQLLALAWRGVIGPDYSNVHASILLGNLIATVVCAITSAVVRSHRSVRIIVSAIALSWVWFVALSIMYAV